ncbi:LLM class flavin-dependent oxidoreductase [Prauserella muralis]|uniref:LLM class F420-dependent oxidoreductase n=1 Tax=Prauserella muralis TaxID=588067 RepID=A0A2V4BBL2_9PSEU|nr:LLM class flavin-dependent oxidoreductase [Prauserella muralis]PXY31912.1 LLM class F420-dependent oxidoreductase [Prauserella muralis]TWE13667.1 putative F420-dependent oxidoreductase [Prauserella muralis]
MRFAISIPQFFTDGEFDRDAFATYVTRAEELGFESGWTQEQVLGSMPQLSPIEVMTYAAACTSRLRLGCSVFVTTLHSPAHLAKSLATLDQLSRGRLEIGVGTGGRRERLFPAFGVDPDTYVARFTEGLRVMRALWTESPAGLTGRFWQLDGVTMQPKPWQKPYPPLWYGGSGAQALRRAARDGHGFFGAGSSPTARFAEQVVSVREALAEAGREEAGFRIAKRAYIAVDDDPARARQRMNDALARIYDGRSPTIESAAVTGTVDDVVAGLHDIARAGAELILLSPVYEQAEQMERLAAEVLPALPR